MPKGLKFTENIAEAAVVDVFLMQIVICEVSMIQACTEIASMMSRMKCDT